MGKNKGQKYKEGGKIRSKEQTEWELRENKNKEEIGRGLQFV